MIPPSPNYYRPRRLSPWPRRLAFALWVGLVLGLVCFFTGCALLPDKGKIKADGVTVTGPKNPGTPATVATATAGTTVPLPAGSTVTVTREEVPLPAGLQSPASGLRTLPRETTVITPAGPTEYRKQEATVRADTGTVDTSVAKHAADVAERRWLLWTAIACGIAGLVVRSMLPAWPSLSNGLLLAAVAAGLSWKLAEVPAWIWLCILAVVALMIAGYKRAEWDKNGDGIPDFAQRKPDPSPSSPSRP